MKYIKYIVAVIIIVLLPALASGLITITGGS